MTDVIDAGVLTTASDLLFSGGREGYAFALDARTGALLWKANVGGQVVERADDVFARRPSVRRVRGRQLACSSTRCDRTEPRTNARVSLRWLLGASLVCAVFVTPQAQAPRSADPPCRTHR